MADSKAAQTFPKELKKLAQEKDYFPEQVFNCDEMGLFWKRFTIVPTSVRI